MAKRTTGKPKTAATRRIGAVYQVKITLRDIQPPIWRRIEIEDCTLPRLHEIIQAAMGWHNCHLHVFEIDGQQYGDPRMGQELEWTDYRKVKLSQLAARGIKMLGYTYDFGDSWEHVIQIEKTVPAEEQAKYPRCLDGSGACPPEDCGGPWGYGDFLQAIRDKSHPEHQDMLEWVGGSFDPEAFDVKQVKKELRRGCK